MHCQANGFAHANEGIKSLLKNNSSMIVKKDSSIEVPTPNFFFSKYVLKVNPQ